MTQLVPVESLATGEYLERCGRSFTYLKAMVGPVVTDDVLGTLGNQVKDWRDRLGVRVEDVAEAVRRMIVPESVGELRFAADVVAMFGRLVGVARRDRLDREERERQAEYLRAKPETPEELENRRTVLGLLKGWNQHVYEGGDSGDETEGGQAAGGDEPEARPETAEPETAQPAEAQADPAGAEAAGGEEKGRRPARRRKKGRA